MSTLALKTRKKGVSNGIQKISGMMFVESFLLIQNATGQMWYGVDGPVPLLIDSLKVTVNYK